MKIGCIQLDIAFADPDQNFSQVEESVRKAAAKGAELVILPETWNTGFDLPHLEQLADQDGKRTKELLSKLSRELNIYIVGGSVATKKNGHFYNTMYVYSNQGTLISEYDKAHLFQLMDEHLYLQAGDQMNRFSVQDIEAGGVICYDIRFPEWLRSHALDGAKVLFVPAQWPKQRVDHWKVLLQARAIENQCFVIAVNRRGSDPNNEFNGQSMIIEPWGNILWTGDADEELAIVDVDFSIVDEIRARIPVYEDRRPELYRPLLSEKH